MRAITHRKARLLGWKTAAATLALAIVSVPAIAEDDEEKYQSDAARADSEPGVAEQQRMGESEHEYEDSAMRDAWLDGKLETALLLNRHLNNFKIDTEVKDGTAHLSGTVQSDIDTDLAQEVARSIDGIRDVESSLTVDPEATASMEEAGAERERTLAQRIDDATMTAIVKSKLLGNSNIAGLAIDVDTRDRIVSLSGNVDSEAAKSLAQQIAENTDDVAEVENNLQVQAEGRAEGRAEGQAEEEGAAEAPEAS